VKLIENNYSVKAYDLVFRYSKNNELQFYYIVKDQQEEEMLNKSIMQDSLKSLHASMQKVQL
jgi:hypothetical protein